MTFKLNQNSVSRRRYGSSTSFSVPSGSSGQAPWTNTGAGGALQFYGNTQSYVQYDNNGEFNLGTGDFTIEWWQYETDTNGAPRPWSFGQYPSAQLAVSFEGSAILWGGGGVLTSFALAQPVQNTRNHFAWVRSQGFTTLWQNGQQLGGVEDTNNYNPSVPLTIGSEGAQDSISCFAGTITNFNIVNYAKYTAPFTPTNTALTFEYATNIFLLPCDTQERFANTVGNYTANPYVTGTDWVNVSPFKFPHPAFPVIPAVTGGVLSSDELYYYRTFTDSDYLSATAPVQVEALVVAGGGSGAPYMGGGGGGGGAKVFSNISLSSGSHFVQVGAGGAGATVYGSTYGPTGNVGNDSVLYAPDYSTLAVTYGGGYGGVWSTGPNGGNGGNGGGGGAGFDPNTGTVGGVSVTDYGYSGGNGSNWPNYGATNGGGGGGAGGSGSGKSGGPGLFFSEWSLATSTGDAGYYAGGGGGSGRNQPGGSGGGGGATDGGRQFSSVNYSLDAAPNTGGGSGGGAGRTNVPNGAGGSGIVIVRYLKTSVGG